MNPSPRLTKQGIRDLNNYGPKPPKVVPGAATPASGGETKDVLPVLADAKDAALPVTG
jgi:hypothetical protein